MKVLLLADTHVPSRASRVPAEVWRALEDCEAVVHAGDYEDARVASELESACAVFHGVRGNMDLRTLPELPEQLVVRLAGIRVGIIHGHQWGRPRPSRVAQAFAGEADVVVFGHNHVPVVRKLGDMWVVNPGSPTCPRGPEGPSYAVMTIDGSGVEIEVRRVGE